MYLKKNFERIATSSAPFKCVLFNGIVILGILSVILIDEDAFKHIVNFGPSDDFYIMGILAINTWARYIGLALAIFIMKASVNMGDEIGWSPLKMQICNPDSNIIIGYSVFELFSLTYALMFEKIFIKFILTLVMISRLDIGGICVIAEVVSKKFSYDHLISKKQILKTSFQEEEKHHTLTNITDNTLSPS